MLTAIVADLLRIPGCEVVTTWDRRLGEFPSCEVAGTLVNPGEPRLKIHCATPQDEAEQFRNLCRTSDAALVIAPEFDGILTDRVATAAPLTTILGPDEPAVSLCSDKLILARFLEERQIATVPTALVNLTEPASHWKFPVVLKPQNGAGSLQTFLVTNSTEFVRRCHEASGAGWASRFIHQPFIPGEPISAAVIIDSTGQRHFLPVVRQLLSENRRFEYLGAEWNPLMGNWQQPATDVMNQVLDAVPGLRGYVGLDLIGSPNGTVHVVDINPRLTSGYLAWRMRTRSNLAECILGTGDPDWSSRAGKFHVSKLQPETTHDSSVRVQS